MNRRSSSKRMIYPILMMLTIHLISAQVMDDQWRSESLHDSLSFAAYDPESNSLLEVSPDGYRISSPGSGSGDFVHVPGLGEYSAHFVFPVKGSGGKVWTLVNEMGGKTFHLTGNELKRIDKDSPGRMSITMTAFIYRDTIFTHGGYGFWSAREYLTWFDQQRGLWKVHKPSQSEEFPPGILNHWTHLIGDSLFVLGGNILDPFDPVNHLPNTNLWRYEIKSRRWYDMGRTNEALAINRYGTYQIKNGDRLLIYPIREKLAEVDFKGGLVRFFKPTALLLDLMSNRHPFSQGFLMDERFHYCRVLDKKTINSRSHRAEWLSIPLSRLYGVQVGEEELVSHGYSSWWWLAIPVLFGVGTLIRKRKFIPDGMISLVDDGFIHRGTHFPASPESVRLVRLLLDSEGPVNNSVIMELFLNPSMDYSHNTRLKIQMVEKTNILLRSILNIDDDPIIFDRSPADKRVRTYAIRREYFRT